MRVRSATSVRPKVVSLKPNYDVRMLTDETLVPMRLTLGDYARSFSAPPGAWVLLDEGPRQAIPPIPWESPTEDQRRIWEGRWKVWRRTIDDAVVRFEERQRLLRLDAVDVDMDGDDGAADGGVDGDAGASAAEPLTGPGSCTSGLDQVEYDRNLTGRVATDQPMRSSCLPPTTNSCMPREAARALESVS